MYVSLELVNQVKMSESTESVENVCVLGISKSGKDEWIQSL